MTAPFDQRTEAEEVLAIWRRLGWNAWLERRIIGEWERFD